MPVNEPAGAGLRSALPSNSHISNHNEEDRRSNIKAEVVVSLELADIASKLSKLV